MKVTSINLDQFGPSISVSFSNMGTVVLNRQISPEQAARIREVASEIAQQVIDKAISEGLDYAEENKT